MYLISVLMSIVIFQIGYFSVPEPNRRSGVGVKRAFHLDRDVTILYPVLDERGDVTAQEQDLHAFIRATFRSVWALELLLHLKRNSERAWSRAELVEAFRASDAVIGTSLDNLLAGGLVVVEDDQHARYCPANDDLERLIGETAMLYAKSPDAVRRLIVSSPASDVSAFADAFRLRRD